MIDYKPLNVLPLGIQRDWQARLHKAEPTEKGVFRLVNVRTTKPGSFEELRIVVLVIDQNGFPLPNVPIAFSYSTADYYSLAENFLWIPPGPQRAFIVPTQGSGQIDQIQGSTVKPGQPGGITVYCLEPEYSSDYITGCGALPDHTGLHFTFKLEETGVKSFRERLEEIDGRLSQLEFIFQTSVKTGEGPTNET